MTRPIGNRLHWATGILLVLVVVAGYAIALRAGHWPPSHPWSGLTLLLLAIGQFLSPRPPSGPLRVTAIGIAALGACAALLWLAAVLVQNPG